MTTSSDAKPLAGKVALVTGGSRGIGRAIALELASRGADIAINYFRNHKEARSAQDEIEALGVRCIRITAHLAEAKQVQKLFKAVSDEFGHLDILVNNAASGVQRSAMELEEKHWDWTMNINTKAPWLCAQAAVPLMSEGGRIVNISSLGSNSRVTFSVSNGFDPDWLRSVPGVSDVQRIGNEVVIAGSGPFLAGVPKRRTNLAPTVRHPRGN